MLYVIFGNDTYGAREAAEALIPRDDADSSQSGVTRLDGSNVQWIKLREACGAMSLFAIRQTIVVRDLLGTWSARGESAGGKGSAARPTPAEFADFAGAMPGVTDLILEEGDLSASNRYLKPLLDLGHDVASVREHAAPKDSSRLEAWAGERIRQTVEKRGGSIDRRATKLLYDRCGADFQKTSHEIDKLLAFTAPLGGITVDDVALLVADESEVNGFSLVDAVASKQAATVVDLCDRLADSGQAPEQPFALVASRIRDLTLLAAAREERVPDDRVIAQSGWQPWRVRQLNQALTKFTPSDLRASQAMLVAADLAFKSRPTHERSLVLLLTLLAITRRSEPSELASALAY
jgi:DNA polymerase III delta subunit